MRYDLTNYEPSLNWYRQAGAGWAAGCILLGCGHYLIHVLYQRTEVVLVPVGSRLVAVLYIYILVREEVVLGQQAIMYFTKHASFDKAPDSQP